MSNPDPARVAKLLELAAHPSSSEGEALNALRALRALLDRSGRSMTDLNLSSPGVGPSRPAEAQARDELDRLQSDNRQLRAENARLWRANAELALLRQRLVALEAESQDSPKPSEADRDRRPPRITADLIAAYDLLAVWRSIPDLAERLGSELGASGVKKIVRLLDDRGLLRCVEAWPTRYRLRPEGELSETAKIFRSRIEEARLPE